MNEPYPLPTGARALLIAMATPTPQGPIGIPVLLWGRPGVGKSSFIEGLAQPDLQVTTLIASIHDPTDFSGLPILEEGTVRYAVPNWVTEFRDDSDGILFLDELSTAPPSVQAALLRVVFERRVGFARLPDSVRIVAAANPPDLMIGGWDLSPPLRNRFVHLQWSIPAELYVRSLSQGWTAAEMPRIDRGRHAEKLAEWKSKVAGFLRLHPDALYGDAEEDAYGFASPRTWDYAAALLASCEVLGLSGDEAAAEHQRTMLQLIAGCLGEGTAIPFLEFINRMRLPPAEDVLNETETIDTNSLDDSELYVLFHNFQRVVLGELTGPALLPHSIVLLRLVEEVFAGGRRDVIFAALRALARGGWIAAIAAGNDPVQREEALHRIGALFQDETFSEFIDVLS